MDRSLATQPVDRGYNTQRAARGSRHPDLNDAACIHYKIQPADKAPMIFDGDASSKVYPR